MLQGVHPPGRPTLPSWSGDSTPESNRGSPAVRIVLAGTQSVGKTTLAGDLVAALSGARIEEEPIRAVARATGEPPPTIPTVAAERRLMEHGLARLRAARPDETVVFDRSPLDAYAHAILSHEIGGPIGRNDLVDLRPWVVEAMAMAELVVLVPLEPGVGNEADGFRYLDDGDRRRVDTILHDLLRPETGLRQGPVARIVGDRDARVAGILRAMRALPALS